MEAVTLNYKCLGDSGQAVIILHGLFGALDNWLTIAKKIADEGFQVFLVDQRNHGKSPHVDEWSYEAMALDLFHFIQDHQINDPVLIGHSMGGKTVMTFEMEYPDISSKNLIADISPKYYPPHHQMIIEGFSTVDLNQIQSRNEAEEKIAAVITDFGIRQFLLKNLSRTSDGFRWKMNLDVIIDNIENVGEGLPIGCLSQKETLFVRGGESDYIMDDEIYLIDQYFTNYSIETIEGAGHWLHAEKPTEFLEIVLNFLNE